MLAPLLHRINSRVKKHFKSLRHYNYRLYWIAQLISVSGTWMQNVALAWLIVTLTNSAVALGTATALQFLPILFFSLFGAAAIPVSAQYKMSTPIAPGVATPDKLDTSIGTLRLTDGDRSRYRQEDLRQPGRIPSFTGVPPCHSDREPGRNARFIAEIRTG